MSSPCVASLWTTRLGFHIIPTGRDHGTDAPAGAAAADTDTVTQRVNIIDRYDMHVQYRRALHCTVQKGRPRSRTTWTPSRSVSTVHLLFLGSREYVWARFVIKIRRSIDGENYRFRTFAHPKFSSKLNRMLKWSTTRREEHVFVVDAVDNKENACAFNVLPPVIS